LSRQKFVDQGFDAAADLVADGPDMVEVLACRVVEDPVFVASAGIIRAGVAATHGDYDIGGFDGVVGEDLGSFGGNIDPILGHGLDGDRIDLVRGFRTGRADFDLATGQLAEVAGGHLGSASIVDANEQNRRFVGHQMSPPRAGWPDWSAVGAGIGCRLEFIGVSWAMAVAVDRRE
jgi:hypothetical protein